MVYTWCTFSSSFKWLNRVVFSNALSSLSLGKCKHGLLRSACHKSFHFTPRWISWELDPVQRLKITTIIIVKGQLLLPLPIIIIIIIIITKFQVKF